MTHTLLKRLRKTFEKKKSRAPRGQQAFSFIELMEMDINEYRRQKGVGTQALVNLARQYQNALKKELER